MTPTTPDTLWLAFTAALSASAIALRLVALDRRIDVMRRLSRLLTAVSLLACIGLIVVRDLLIARPICPIENNFDSAILFAALIGGLSFYMLAVSRRGRASSADLLFVPVMLGSLCYGLLIGVGVLPFRAYASGGMWRPVHLGMLVLGSLALIYAAVVGLMYLLVDRALRSKARGRLTSALPSLERLEANMRHGVLLGFWLLTIGMLAGLFLVINEPVFTFDKLLSSLKFWIATAAWLVYALVLNVQVIPQFRGRRAAWFSIAGFVLVAATYVIVQLVPMG
jgi:ABC-type uncharacterized transport system permease subunit